MVADARRRIEDRAARHRVIDELLVDDLRQAFTEMIRVEYGTVVPHVQLMMWRKFFARVRKKCQVREA